MNSNTTGTITPMFSSYDWMKPNLKQKAGTAQGKWLVRKDWGKLRGVKSLFLSENMLEKWEFSSQDFNFKDSILVFWIVLTVLHFVTAKIESYLFTFLLWKMTKVSTCRSKLRGKLRSSIEKYIALKHFNTSKTYLVLKSRYRCLFWAFSLCCSPSNTWVNWGFRSGVFVWLIQKYV